jgi:hypothetical protein
MSGEDQQRTFPALVKNALTVSIKQFVERGGCKLSLGLLQNRTHARLQQEEHAHMVVPSFEGRAASGQFSQRSLFVKKHREPSYGGIIRDEARPMETRE